VAFSLGGICGREEGHDARHPFTIWGTRRVPLLLFGVYVFLDTRRDTPPRKGGDPEDPRGSLTGALTSWSRTREVQTCGANVVDASPKLRLQRLTWRRSRFIYCSGMMGTAHRNSTISDGHSTCVRVLRQSLLTSSLRFGKSCTFLRKKFVSIIIYSCFAEICADCWWIFMNAKVKGFYAVDKYLFVRIMNLVIWMMRFHECPTNNVYSRLNFMLAHYVFHVFTVQLRQQQLPETLTNSNGMFAKQIQSWLKCYLSRH
jgi:hypothetical protein